MKTAIGITVIRYRAKCPYCGENTYNHIHTKEWSSLDYEEGKPFGIINCQSCKEDFELSIGDEIL